MFSVSRSPGNPFFKDKLNALVIDGQPLAVPAYQSGTAPDTVFFARKDDTWEVRDRHSSSTFPCLTHRQHHTKLQEAERVQASGRMSLILNSRAPLLFVIPDKSDAGALLAALRSGDAQALGAALSNDLTEASLSLRPELAATLDVGRQAEALGAIISGSGPTCLFLASDEQHSLDIAIALAGAGGCADVVQSTGPVPGVRFIG